MKPEEAVEERKQQDAMTAITVDYTERKMLYSMLDCYLDTECNCCEDVIDGENKAALLNFASNVEILLSLSKKLGFELNDQYRERVENVRTAIKKMYS